MRSRDRNIHVPTHLRALLLAMVVAFLGIWHARAVPDPATEEARVDDAIQRVISGTSIPEGLHFTQKVTLRAYLLRWTFESELSYTSGELVAETRGAPWFVPETLPAELVRLGRTLSLFELNPVGYDQEADELHLRGPRPDYDGSGAKEGSFWIDVSRGVVRKAEAVYSWGILAVEQEYESLGEHLLLKRQSARISPHGATLEVLYDNYIFP